MIAAAPPLEVGTGLAHGKVILLGEHAVVHGRPALAAALARGVRAQARRAPGPPRLRVPAWGLDVRIDEELLVARGLAAALGSIGLAALEVELTIEPSIPSRVGLGSSAALAVAAARAAAALAGRPLSDEAASAAGLAAERVFHGTPSGVDNELAARGGVGRFRRGEGFRRVAVGAPLALAIGLSGQPRDTAARVADVTRRRERAPDVVEPILDAIGALVERGVDAVVRGDRAALGEALDVNHGLLAALGLSTGRLERLRELAQAGGALGAKLTGGGGGGCLLALCGPDGAAPILAAWSADGFEGFAAEVRP